MAICRLRTKMLDGVTREWERRRYNTLRERLRVLYKEQSQILWQELCDKASTSEPKVFWKMVKQMTGSKPEPPAIQDVDGRQLDTDEAICEAFTKKLENQFRISEDENKDFDQQFEFEIRREHQLNLPHPPQIIDINRLSNQGQDKQFDLAAVLNSMKAKAPGQSGITRRYLREMPL